MSVVGIEVVRPGMHDTVQDLGRFGRQAQGFSPAGPMDRRSAAIANILVGNSAEAALLECAVTGPTLRFMRACTVCVTGADMPAELDGEPVAPYAALPVGEGSVLRLHPARWGVYAYVAVAGGIGVPSVLGSRSTAVAYALGGVEGRPLKAGDVLPVPEGAPAEVAGWQARRLESCDAYFRRTVAPGTERRPATLRAVLADGTEGAPTRSPLWGKVFRVLPQSNRMGVRLEPVSGGAVPVRCADLVSEAVVLGTVQLPASGEPIVAMADHQTTGGYAKAGTVAAVDLPRLAQSRPGELVRFEPIDVAAAQELVRGEARYLSGLRAMFDGAVRRFG